MKEFIKLYEQMVNRLVWDWYAGVMLLGSAIGSSIASRDGSWKIHISDIAKCADKFLDERNSRKN